MLFNSRAFLLFFLAVTSLYFLIPHRYRWMLLLGSSVLFYMWFVPKYILLMLFVVLVDYGAALVMEKAASRLRRQLILAAALVANLGLLGFFKYANFFSDNLAALARLVNWNYGLPALQIILPIGISFFTFQGLSYVLDVYWGRQKAERHPGMFFLFIAFYPQLVAGPIERTGHLLPQFSEVHRFDYQRAKQGIQLMLWGLFKKAVIADRAAILVNNVYANVPGADGFTLIVATILFGFQIYCDFSGYSDIAVGSAEVMGFRIMRNFERPYFAKSIAEFWRRWHISLTSWFRDYLYIPLGGNRVALPRWYFNIFLVFFVSGLWHGANWTFAIWGALHGAYFIASFITRKWREAAAGFLRLGNGSPIRKIIQAGTTFSLVTFAWIFFRARTLEDALVVIAKIPDGIRSVFDPSRIAAVVPQWKLTGFELILALLAIVFLLLVEFFQRRTPLRPFINRQPAWARWAIGYGLILVCYFLGVFDNIEFIYFQF